MMTWRGWLGSVDVTTAAAMVLVLVALLAMGCEMAGLVPSQGASSRGLLLFASFFGLSLLLVEHHPGDEATA